MQCPGTAVAAGRYAWCPSQAHLVWEAGAGGWVVLEVLPAAAIPILDDQVDGHLSLEAGDVAVTEVVAQVVDLGGHRGTGGATRGGRAGVHRDGGSILLQLQWGESWKVGGRGDKMGWDEVGK